MKNALTVGILVAFIVGIVFLWLAVRRQVEQVAAALQAQTADIQALATALAADTQKVRIILNDKGAGCAARAVPNRQGLVKGDDKAVLWTIKDRKQCLQGWDAIEIRFTNANPFSNCAAPITATPGHDKRCDLRNGLNDGELFPFKIYRVRKTGNPMTQLLLDPDLEIVDF